jgi:hypothetical protein
MQHISIQGTIPDELLTINRVLLSGLALTGPLPDLAFQLPEVIVNSYPHSMYGATLDDVQQGFEDDSLPGDSMQQQQQQNRRVRRPLEWQMLRNSGLRPLQPPPQGAGGAAATAAAGRRERPSAQYASSSNAVRREGHGRKQAPRISSSSSSRSPRDVPASGSSSSSRGPLRHDGLLLLADQQMTGGFEPVLSVFWLFEHCLRFSSWVGEPQSVVSFAVPADGQLAIVLPGTSIPAGMVNAMAGQTGQTSSRSKFQQQQQQQQRQRQGDTGSSSSSKRSWPGVAADITLVKLKVKRQRALFHAEPSEYKECSQSAACIARCL